MPASARTAFVYLKEGLGEDEIWELRNCAERNFPELYLSNGRKCFMGPKKSKEDKEANRFLNTTFKDICRIRGVHFERYELQRPKGAAVGVRRGWGKQFCIYIDGLRTVWYDMDTSELGLVHEKLLQLS